MSRTGLDVTAPIAHVRGVTACNRPAPFLARVSAFAADLAIAIAIFCAALALLRLPPAPRAAWIPLASGSLAIPLLIVRQLLGQTPGGCLWGIRRGILLQSSEARAVLAGGFLTLFAVAAAGLAFDVVFLSDPLWATSDVWEMDPYLPANMQSSDGERWSIAPYFYTLGAWPRTFLGHPVFFSVPYEKGPPARFVGHISARWDDPDTRVTFEGPKTPLKSTGSPPPDREALRRCLSGPAAIECLATRETSLERHIEEMRAASPTRWTVKWFLVRNAALPPEEQAQGVYLSAAGALRGEDRFVFITASGTHQAVILDYPMTDSGRQARALFNDAIRSLRVSDQLGPGRAWVDREIERVRLDQLSTASDYADTQALLLSKISVDPGGYAAYFHLGGTAMLLVRLAAKTHDAGTAAIAKPLVAASYKFAQDIAPGDPRTTQLQSLWLDSRNY